MAKVHPHMSSSSSSASSSSSSLKETFTVWMKSLVLHGNGFTVYNSKGEIVYRIDNYHTKCSREVCLMDLHGKVLCTLIQRDMVGMLKRWDGYKDDDRSRKPWFQVKKICKHFGGDFACKVKVGSWDDVVNAESCCYRMEGSAEKCEVKIIDEQGLVVAEVKRKQLDSGMMLGDDVLNLVVQPHHDHSFVVSLVAILDLGTHRLFGSLTALLRLDDQDWIVQENLVLYSQQWLLLFSSSGASRGS
ncbi:hypothetical protein Ancab_014795 [Ancistrocladus abbreviatus]